MTQQSYIDILIQGRTIWNAWRAHHPERIDLRDIDLVRADLRDANLARVRLDGAHLRFARLSGASLNGSHLRDADLRFAHLNGTHLIGADLTHADLHGAHLDGADLSRARLRFAHLSRAHLTEANLSFADLTNVDLMGTDLSRADLSGADLIGANLSRAELSGADLSHARIGWTSFGDRDLRTIKGLETIRHEAPSPLSITTVYQSQGALPDAFLRGTGAPESFLVYLQALAATPIEHFHCVISYAPNDQDFAEQLSADLQRHTIRCWHAPKDRKPRTLIGEALRLYDHLLLVLSQHSVKSAWVEKEVTAVLKQEQQRHKRVLFPIVLDDAIMHTPQTWAVALSRSRVLADFTRWKELDAYQQALQQLLHALR